MQLMDSDGVCVNSEYFYQKLQELKESTKSKTSQTILYIDDEFYDQAKTWLNLSREQRKLLARNGLLMLKRTLSMVRKNMLSRKDTCTEFYEKHILPHVTVAKINLRNTFKCLTMEFPSTW